MLQQACIQCGRVEVGGHLWCQQADCPVGRMPTLFGYGDVLGAVEVVKLLTVLPTAAIYHAQRAGEDVWLKVAHAGYEAWLRREVDLLNTLENSVWFPKLLATEPNKPNSFFGQTVKHNRACAYTLFESVIGESLRDYLLRTPSPWYQHTGWIVAQVAKAVNQLHQAEMVHCMLLPESVWVRMDAKGVPRVLLLDLGMACRAKQVEAQWPLRQMRSAYVAPELLEKSPRPAQATDVYGVGLILYEMLAGRGAYHDFGRTNTEIWQAVKRGEHPALNRAGSQGWSQLVERAINTTPAQRPHDVLSISDALEKNLPPLPSEKQPFDWSSQRLYLIIVGVIVAALFVILLYFLVNNDDSATVPTTLIHSLFVVLSL